MAKMNYFYKNLQENYLFSEIASRVRTFTNQNPQEKLIRMGIGDVSLPLCPSVIQAMHAAVNDMAKPETFHGYGPEQGYGFLRDAIRTYYENFGVSLQNEEIFVSDGAKSDLGNILDLFSSENKVWIPDPVYPVYADTNIMQNRNIVYMPANRENGFLPMPDENAHADIIYLCSPNNPTGAVYNRAQLQIWVDYALRHNSIILFDAAYEAFIGDDLPHSIYEIDGASRCAIEFCSLSKTAGFTGTRCGYTIVPLQCIRDSMCLNKMWLRRQSTKFNGVSYVVQRAAAAVFTPQGQIEVKKDIATYQNNAKLIASTMAQLNIFYTGGKNSPYIWFECPNQLDSWEFFDQLLTNAKIVGTPGSGFGECGKGFFRFSAFSSPSDTQEAMQRFAQFVQKL